MYLLICIAQKLGNILIIVATYNFNLCYKYYSSYKNQHV